MSGKTAKKKRKLIIAGKTKAVYQSSEPGCVECVYNTKITKFDNPKYTQEFPSKARHSNAMNTAMMEMIKRAGIPTAFERELSDISYLARDCDMFDLEVVVRREGHGSLLKRNPHLNDGEVHRFGRLIVEFFLKTSEFATKNGKQRIKGLRVEDPLIMDAYQDEWDLADPGKPNYKGLPLGDLKIRIPANVSKEDLAVMENIARKVFLLIEAVWRQFGLKLLDFKLEFGRDKKTGQILLGDVLDQDSVRILNEKGEHYSKQAFRNNEAMSEVERKYGVLAELCKMIRIPRQALVVWSGSKSDPLPKNIEEKRLKTTGIDLIYIDGVSGHKATLKSLRKLNNLMRDYPEGGAIITLIGRSNGCGPTLQAHTLWPVIAAPTTIKEFPLDIWSNIRMPSDVAMTTAWPPENAYSAALNILAMRNPILYMHLQYALEERDEYDAV